MHMNTEKNRNAPDDKNTFQAALIYVIQDMLYERNFKQKQLAEAWQVNQSTVSRIFSGASPVTIAKVEQAAGLFGVNIYDLLYRAHTLQLDNAQKANLRTKAATVRPLGKPAPPEKPARETGDAAPPRFPSQPNRQ